MKSKLALCALAALAVFLGNTAIVNAAADTIGGKWETNFGTMILRKTGGTYEGIYDFRNGILVNTRLSGQTLRGNWIQESADVECDEPVEDSSGNEQFFWGRFRFTFGADAFSGVWDYCGEGLNAGNWTGKR